MADLVAIQMVSCPDVQENLQQVEAMLQNIQVDTETLVVLPECFARFGGGDKGMLEIAETPGDGPIQSALSQMSQRYGVWLVAGTIPLMAPSGNKFTASSLLYNPKGEQLAEYQKMHLFDVEVGDNTGSYLESRYTEGGSELVVVDTPFGRLGMAVCYDIRFAGMFQAMGQVELLVLPAAFTEKNRKGTLAQSAHCQSHRKSVLSGSG